MPNIYDTTALKVACIFGQFNERNWKFLDLEWEEVYPIIQKISSDWDDEIDVQESDEGSIWQYTRRRLNEWG